MPEAKQQSHSSKQSATTKNKEAVDEKQQLNFSIDYELDKRFRKVVYENKGLRRGAMVEAFQEALEMWIEELESNDKK